jgi:hypothetical protein
LISEFNRVDFPELNPRPMASRQQNDEYSLPVPATTELAADIVPEATEEAQCAQARVVVV